MHPQSLRNQTHKSRDRVKVVVLKSFSDRNEMHLHFTADFTSPGVASQVALRVHLFAPRDIRFLLPFQAIDVHTWLFMVLLLPVVCFLFCAYWAPSLNHSGFAPGQTPSCAFNSSSISVAAGSPPSKWGSAEIPSVSDREKTLSYNSVYKPQVPT